MIKNNKDLKWTPIKKRIRSGFQSFPVGLLFWGCGTFNDMSLSLYFKFRDFSKFLTLFFKEFSQFNTKLLFHEIINWIKNELAAQSANSISPL